MSALTAPDRVGPARHAPMAATGEPTVTVVIPCYNYALYLPEAVASALSQEGVRVDVVVVDDASTDESFAVARGLARFDARVRVFAHAENQGAVATFNDGLAEATGEYIVRLDADDLLTPGSLARSVALGEAFPAVGLIYGHPVHFSGVVPSGHRDRVKAWDVWRGGDWLADRCRRGVNCITSPEVVLRRSVVDEVGGQRPLAHTHDMEMWFRVARASDVGWVAGVDQAWHREHDGSLSRSNDVLSDLHERALAFEVLFSDGMGDEAENQRLLSIAERALADEALARAASAYAKGRGGSAETEAYLEFAAARGVDVDRLPHARTVAHAERVGPARARFSPTVVARAGLFRASREFGRFAWRARGV
ncbi:glycosyl transferase [Leifsonia sp. LS1]|uniref:glycosyltransferase family 2 protein n=1 Tax=Leifsonia sp. LS1 TaxID=2828483 RepID=UPI001CFE1580|nr:glycosyltransferase family 2 protein [Leifsonia sp. LS1]GIT79647.1 glycosyl transferase [Leifsonia sp. LS1]